MIHKLHRLFTVGPLTLALLTAWMIPAAEELLAPSYADGQSEPLDSQETENETEAALYVTNNGVDTQACGTKEAPCRSISQAIAYAKDGDRILVGPGRYGDINGNGSFSDSGDESAEFNFGCFCMIKVNKSIKLKSSDGAAVTLLDAGGTDLRVVVIQANGVTFGGRIGGFTMTNARREGLLLDGNTLGVTVMGNIAERTGTNGNDAITIQGGQHKVVENIAINNARAGLGIHGSGHMAISNVSSNNLLGYNLTFSGRFAKNYSTGNQLNGMDVNANGLQIDHNAIIGNKQLGLRVFTSNVSITENNIFGNGTLGGNCGLQSDAASLAAPYNFWGVASGPGPDPADAVCVSATGNVVTVAPVATQPFKIQAKFRP